jgi:hypothetical protein
MDHLLQYYGVDWAATAGTLISLWLLSEQRRSGFAVGVVAAAGWFAFGILASSMATLIANGLLFALNMRGYRRWQPRDA